MFPISGDLVCPAEFALKLLKEEKVAVVPGDSFGDCGRLYTDFLCRIPRRLKEAINRISCFCPVTGRHNMKPWEKEHSQVLPYIPGEQPRHADIIKLNTNENPYPPSPRVGEAMEHPDRELRLYPDSDSGIRWKPLRIFME